MTRIGGVETIKDGPNRDRLIDCYKYACDTEVTLLVTFVTEDGVKYTVRITSLSHESGDGESHMFEARIIEDNRSELFRASGTHATSTPDMTYMRGCFHTASPRHGWLQRSGSPFPTVRPG